MTSTSGPAIPASEGDDREKRPLPEGAENPESQVNAGR